MIGRFEDGPMSFDEPDDLPMTTLDVARDLMMAGDVVRALDMAMGKVGPLVAPRRLPLVEPDDTQTSSE